VKVVKVAIAVCATLVALVLAAGFLLPTEVSIEREIAVDAGLEHVLPLVDELARWREWDPWFAEDPTLEEAFEGPPSGVGARRTWSSRSPDVGAGSVTITRAGPRRIEYALEFADTDFTANGRLDLEPAGDTTTVSWRIEAAVEDTLTWRYAAFFWARSMRADCDRGLANLKRAAESAAAAG